MFINYMLGYKASQGCPSLNGSVSMSLGRQVYMLYNLYAGVYAGAYMCMYTYMSVVHEHIP